MAHLDRIFRLRTDLAVAEVIFIQEACQEKDPGILAVKTNELVELRNRRLLILLVDVLDQKTDGPKKGRGQHRHGYPLRASIRGALGTTTSTRLSLFCEGDRRCEPKPTDFFNKTSILL